MWMKPLPKIPLACPTCGKVSDFDFRYLVFTWWECKHSYKISVEKLPQIISLLKEHNLIEEEEKR
jgi:hypothetical protein